MLHKEGRKPSDHFEDNVPEGPPVSSNCDIHSFLESLGREILRSPCDRVCLFELMEMTAESEVNESDKTLSIDENIFRFETISVEKYSR